METAPMFLAYIVLAAMFSATVYAAINTIKFVKSIRG